MKTFTRSSHLPVPCEEAFAWHEGQGRSAFERTLPPWEQIQILEKTGSIHDGDKLTAKIKFGPFSVLFSMQHQNFIKNKQFEDIQLKGPFSYWKHTRTFEKIDGHTSRLTEQVEYKLPLGILSPLFNASFVEDKLDKFFAFRHRTLINDLYFHSKYSQKKLKILVTGASGFVGHDLVPFLITGGHHVLTLSRNISDEGKTDVVVWDVKKKNFIHPNQLEGLDAVVHLAGENIASHRWNEKRKQELIDSRVNFTKDLCHAFAALNQPPKTFISASGTGIFGNRDADDILTEESKLGEGFLAKLAHDWEGASREMQKVGTRVVHLRFGAIISSAGGLLQKLLTPYKLFMGGPMGHGRQMLPWISMVDVLGLILFSMANDKVVGPVNAVSPQVVNNSQFSEILAQALDRPNSLRVPELMVELLFGEMGKEMILSGQHAMPNKAIKLGFEFVQSHLHDAISYYLGC
jgi:uncharacterized protein (TIGR01777 family)